jgi:hypothetical protein
MTRFIRENRNQWGKHMPKSRAIYRVLPDAENRTWGVKRGKKLIAVFSRKLGETKQDAVAYAIKQAKAHQPSQLIIHKRDGKIEEERTYPRSSDPRRSKG